MNAGTPRPSSPVRTPEALDGELRATLGRAQVPRLSAEFEARIAARIATKSPRRMPWLLTVVRPLLIWAKAAHMFGFLWK